MSFSSPQTQDHPRLRGEQDGTITLEALLMGSPPLARGTAQIEMYAVQQRGITPACAGNSVRPLARVRNRVDQPRLRGEQGKCVNYCRIFLGSPPLARGTGLIKRRKVAKWGITPACAGNSHHSMLYLRVRWDHPRLRGEQAPRGCRQGRGAGSPPLARGTEL